MQGLFTPELYLLLSVPSHMGKAKREGEKFVKNEVHCFGLRILFSGLGLVIRSNLKQGDWIMEVKVKAAEAGGKA